MVDINEKLQSKMAEIESSQEEMVPMSEVRGLLDAVRSLFEGRFDEEDVKLYGELGELARFINSARKDLREFQPHYLADKDIPDASDQLDAIVTTTEQATRNIMDYLDQLQSNQQRVIDRLIAHEPPLDEDVLAGIDDAMSESESLITSIYEACTFQDLTGQRIMKIVKTLKEIERQVLRMVVVFGLNQDKVDDETRKELEEEANLLEGPQLPGNSLDQDDIDDILSKLL